MQQLTGILLHVYPADANLLAVAEHERAALGKRVLILADLIALWQIGIKVVLSIELREQRYFAIEGEPDHNTTLDGLRVWHWQCSGKPQANGAGMCVWLLAKVIAAAPAEHFGRGAQLHVNFQTNYGLICCRRCVVPHRSGFLLLHSVTCSYWCATFRMRSSIKWGPMTCKPIGRSSLEKPQQILIPGSPAMLEGSSSASATSPNIAWFLLDPTGHAVEGLVGPITTSTSSNALAKSSTMSVLAF